MLSFGEIDSCSPGEVQRSEAKPGAGGLPRICASGARSRDPFAPSGLQNQLKQVNIALQRCAAVYFGPLQSDNSDEGGLTPQI
jgi:hypothetical protein